MNNASQMPTATELYGRWIPFQQYREHVTMAFEKKQELESMDRKGNAYALAREDYRNNMTRALRQGYSFEEYVYGEFRNARNAWLHWQSRVRDTYCRADMTPQLTEEFREIVKNYKAAEKAYLQLKQAYAEATCERGRLNDECDWMN